MVRKYLYDQSSVNEREDGKKGFLLQYYLLENESDSYGKNCNKVNYGIEIVKKCAEDVSENIIIRELTSSYENANTILDVISRNKVTPVTLPYILEDFAGMF
jgi:hypothetical protein